MYTKASTSSLTEETDKPIISFFDNGVNKITFANFSLPCLKYAVNCIGNVKLVLKCKVNINFACNACTAVSKPLRHRFHGHTVLN